MPAQVTLSLLLQVLLASARRRARSTSDWLRAALYRTVLVDCRVCGGGGFVGYGTGYGNVCGECGGQCKEPVDVLRVWPFPPKRPEARLGKG